MEMCVPVVAIKSAIGLEGRTGGTGVGKGPGGYKVGDTFLLEGH